MPELPEVETIRRALEEPLLGARVVRAELRRRDVCEAFGVAGKPVAPSPRLLLQGARIARLERHGKQLAIVAGDGRCVCIHLGMSGQLLISSPRRRDGHTHAVWTLDTGAALSFRDPRRFGGLWAFAAVEGLKSRWSALGPDGLTGDLASARDAVLGSRRAIKAVLLDQAVIAGVGNIYADEALFAAGIRPSRPASRLTGAEFDRLMAQIRGVLRRAVEARGTTLRDYVTPDGSPGRAQLAHAVYGRAGKPCPNCGKRLTRATVAQRTTVYCTRCQR